MAQTSMSSKSYSSDSGGSPTGSPGRATSSSHNSRTYMCKVCGLLFTSGQSLGGHMNVHRKDQQRSPQSSTPPPSGDYNSPGPNPSTTPGYKGVRYRKQQNKWVAEIRPPRANKTWWLGTYSTPEEAAYAYDVAITYFGSESSLNFDGHPIYEQIPRIATDLPNQDFAIALRKVVKKYGKLAMDQSGSSGGSGPSTTQPVSVSDDQPDDQLLDWELDNFIPPPPDHEISCCNSSGTAEMSYSPFDFEETAIMQPPPESANYQLPDYDQANSDYYGHGYQQHCNWPPYS